MWQNLTTMIIPAASSVVSAAIILTIRYAAFRLLHSWAERTKSKIDDLILSSLRAPTLYWAVALGIYTGIAVSEVPQKYASYLAKLIHIIVIFSVTMASADVSVKLLNNYIERLNLPIPTTGLAHGILKGTIITLGLLVILGVLGISIAPFITALGVGGLAVALALQDTIGNLFAGIHILVEQSIRVGDFVRLESGQEGYVHDITWRTTRVRMLPNNMVVIPNSKLSQSIVTNYYMPEKRMSVLIPISVSYSCKPEKIEEILVEEATRAAGEVPGMLTDPKPFVRFIPGFGESSLDFTIICQVQEFVDQYLAQHELRKRIFKRFAAEGIEIPFPQRTVHMRKEKDE